MSSILFQLATYHFLFHFLYIVFVCFFLFSRMLQDCFHENTSLVLADVCVFKAYESCFMLYSLQIVGASEG